MKANRILSVAVMISLALPPVMSACRTASAPDAVADAGARYSPENQVTLYGRHSCPLCTNFVAALEARGIAYRFFDVDAEPQRAHEMWELINQHFPGNQSVGLPVVRVNGTVLIRPPFARFESYLKKLK
jgi:glutaredoxin